MQVREGDASQVQPKPRRLLACIVEVPQLGPLVFRIPAMRGGAEGEDALFGAALFLVAAGTAFGTITSPKQISLALKL